MIRNAIELASGVRGLELALNATVCDRYQVAVAARDGATVIGLGRLSTNSR